MFPYFDIKGSWNPSSWKTRVRLSYFDNTMGADGLETQTARASAVMLTTTFYYNISASAAQILRYSKANLQFRTTCPIYNCYLDAPHCMLSWRKIHKSMITSCLSNRLWFHVSDVHYGHTIIKCIILLNIVITVHYNTLTDKRRCLFWGF